MIMIMIMIMIMSISHMFQKWVHNYMGLKGTPQTLMSSTFRVKIKRQWRSQDFFQRGAGKARNGGREGRFFANSYINLFIFVH